MEISKTKSPKMKLLIAAFAKEGSESLLISLPESRAKDIESEFQNDYEMMSRSL